VRLLAELVLHQLVDSKDLFSQHLILVETFRHKRDFTNGLEIWNHHSHWAELVGQVVRQLTTACVAGIHSNKQACGVIHFNVFFIQDTVVLFSSLLNCFEDLLHLAGHDGQYIKQDTVKLVETAPRS